MDLLCMFTDLALPTNPKIIDFKNAEPLQGVFSSFQKHDVKYVVLGGIASVLYGVPRATFVLDILIEAGR